MNENTYICGCVVIKVLKNIKDICYEYKVSADFDEFS